MLLQLHRSQATSSLESAIPNMGSPFPSLYASRATIVSKSIVVRIGRKSLSADIGMIRASLVG